MTEMDDEAAPTDADCCNNGCSPCVYDIYKNRLGRKRRRDVATFRFDLLSDTKFKPFHVIKKHTIGHNVYLFTFQPEINKVQPIEISRYLEPVHIDGVLPYKPGQHFILKQGGTLVTSKPNGYIEHDITDNIINVKQNVMLDVLSTNSASKEDCDNDEKKQNFLTKAYTPISLSNEEKNCCFDMVIKIYPYGKMSNYLNNLNSGDVVHFRGPYGDFEYVANKYKHILMICVGTGIAPFYPIIRSILDDEYDETIVKLIYGCRSIGSILFHERLTEMALFWNFSVDYYLSSVESKIQKVNENFFPGRIGEKAILNELTGMQHDRLTVLICGTDEFNREIIKILSKRDIGNSNVFVF